MGELLRRREMMTASGGSEPSVNLLYNWDFTKSATDTIAGKTATYTGTIGDDGIRITATNKYILLPECYNRNRTIWIAFTTFNCRKGGTNGSHGRVIMASKGADTSANGSGFVYRGDGTITFYTGSWNSVSTPASGKYNYFENSTLKMYVDSNGIASVYKDSELFMTSTGKISSARNGQDYVIGESYGGCVAYVTVATVKIYEGFVI